MCVIFRSSMYCTDVRLSRHNKCILLLLLFVIIIIIIDSVCYCSFYTFMLPIGEIKMDKDN